MKKEEITQKNTKAEILQALNEALEREKNILTIKSDPKREEKEKIVEKAIETSKVNVEQKIFSEELNNKFKDLEIAIRAEEEKLENLYGVEKVLQNITTVINAEKDCIVRIEEEKANKTEELNKEIEILEKEYKQKSMELQKQYENESKILKTEREREIEEYNYKQKREREKENNKWEDEKAERESKLLEIEEKTEQLLTEVEEKADYTKELEVKVNEIPQLLQKEYERGKNEVSEELERENNHKMELIEKDYVNTINKLEYKVETLTEELDKVNKLNIILQEKLDKSYIEIKDLATKTVQSAGGVRIIGNSANENK